MSSLPSLCDWSAIDTVTAPGRHGRQGARRIGAKRAYALIEKLLAQNVHFGGIKFGGLKILHAVTGCWIGR